MALFHRMIQPNPKLSTTISILIIALLFIANENNVCWGYIPTSIGLQRVESSSSTALMMHKKRVLQPSSKRLWMKNCNDFTNKRKRKTPSITPKSNKSTTLFFSTALILSILLPPPSTATTTLLTQPANALEEDTAIISCLFRKCTTQLASCITNPRCLANVICINTCNNRPNDEKIGCQIKCGDIFENDMVGTFNKCALSDKECVPTKTDDGSYPIPPREALVEEFDTKLFQGRWYITAGQNPLFDIFPCQVHFFTQPSPGKFYGKLNWRIEEPDGEFFTRDALQRFVQDPNQPSHLINHDNEYLHYEDDWYILDYEYDDNPRGIPPFALVYYRGSNDAWIGYGGAVLYTRSSTFPEELRPRLRNAVSKINHYNFDTDFTLTDNTCRIMNDDESIMLREKFAGKVLLQTEEELRMGLVKVRGNALNSVKAQVLFVEKEIGQAEKAFGELEQRSLEFEREVVGNEKEMK